MRVSSSSAAAVLQATLGADASTAVSAATMQRCLRFDQGGTLLGCDSKHASTATGALCGWAHEGGAPCRVTAAPHAACTSMHCPAGAYARSRFRVCSQPPPKSHLRPLHLGCPTTRGRGARTSITSPSTATMRLMNTSSSRKEEAPMPLAGWKMMTSPGVGGLRGTAEISIASFFSHIEFMH